MREIRTSGSTRGGAPWGPLLLYRLGNRSGAGNRARRERSGTAAAREVTTRLLPGVLTAGGAAEFVEDGIGFFELGEEFFGVAEDFGMNAAAGPFCFDGVADV